MQVPWPILSGPYSKYFKVSYQDSPFLKSFLNNAVLMIYLNTIFGHWKKQHRVVIYLKKVPGDCILRPDEQKTSLLPLYNH